MSARPHADAALGDLREQLAAARASWSETGETTLVAGEWFLPDEPVEIFVRKRGHRYDLDDHGRAVALARKPAGWLEAASCVVAQEGFNVNRAGVVFVPAVEGRDLALLALRLAKTARAVFAELIELD